LGVEDARNGQGKAGQPDECDGNSGNGFAHPGSQWVNDGDISIIEKKHNVNTIVLTVLLEYRVGDGKIIIWSRSVMSSGRIPFEWLGHSSSTLY